MRNFIVENSAVLATIFKTRVYRLGPSKQFLPLLFKTSSVC